MKNLVFDSVIVPKAFASLNAVGIMYGNVAVFVTGDHNKMAGCCKVSFTHGKNYGSVIVQLFTDEFIFHGNLGGDEFK